MANKSLRIPQIRYPNPLRKYTMIVVMMIVLVVTEMRGMWFMAIMMMGPGRRSCPTVIRTSSSINFWHFNRSASRILRSYLWHFNRSTPRILWPYLRHFNRTRIS